MTRSLLCLCTLVGDPGGDRRCCDKSKPPVFTLVVDKVRCAEVAVFSAPSLLVVAEGSSSSDGRGESIIGSPNFVRADATNSGDTQVDMGTTRVLFVEGRGNGEEQMAVMAVVGVGAVSWYYTWHSFGRR